ncbi:SDR family oxidoreductase [bacterium]|nr:SDR family oxidoreductase [bacterium]
MRVLILGVTGMLGNAMFRVFAEIPEHEVYGSARSESAKHYFNDDLGQNIICGVDAENHDSLTRVFGLVKPDVLINCVGLVKQLADAGDPLLAMPINSMLPHRLAALCRVYGARFVHISTDCVFSGKKGAYLETDFPDADDLYGRTKLLGEVDSVHTITLRTSIIGHELFRGRSLINWFLSQHGSIKGFTRAIFSGVPTVVLAKIIRDVIILRPELHGVYHVAAKPISKYDLLNLISEVYGKQIEIVPDDKLVIDRSLNAERFREATGYVAPAWDEMIKFMHSYK